MTQQKTTYKIIINWKGELKTYHTTAENEMKGIRNCCHKLGKETNISGNYILRQLMDTTKIHVQRV